MLTKQYNKTDSSLFTAIQDISCTIERGEITCIIGHSGCGKSTFLQCINGIDQHYTGTITINNILQKNYLQNKRIAFVSQKYSNFPWLNVYENIEIGFYKSTITKEEKHVLIESILHKFGLYQSKNLYPATLSGGMQQRVAIARSIAQNTEIITLDEPFGALDVYTKKEMQNFLLEIQKKEKKTIVLVTHDIDEAIYIADRIIIIGSHPGIIQQHFYKETIKNNKKLKSHISHIISSSIH